MSTPRNSFQNFNSARDEAKFLEDLQRAARFYVDQPKVFELGDPHKGDFIVVDELFTPGDPTDIDPWIHDKFLNVEVERTLLLV